MCRMHLILQYVGIDMMVHFDSGLYRYQRGLEATRGPLCPDHTGCWILMLENESDFWNNISFAQSKDSVIFGVEAGSNMQNIPEITL